ncbi:VOC family protein [Herbiconiux sp. YIM B11900]|uniref:VOC family protein n=1 Tax=Herbiconiux sp. YIM B11900 TaxID=3404131 RepID=UPI003F855729
MKQGVDFITLSTGDLEAVRAFYRDGLGWTPLLDLPGEILFFQVGHGLVLGLFEAGAFAAGLLPVPDATGAAASDATGAASVDATDAASVGRPASAPAGLTLSQNVGSAAEVDAAVERMAAAGGAVRKAPQRAAFGGYHAHVEDPNGVIWEIAFNPGWSVGDDGAVSLMPVEGD